jgi:hypothetical protein
MELTEHQTQNQGLMAQAVGRLGIVRAVRGHGLGLLELACVLAVEYSHHSPACLVNTYIEHYNAHVEH